MQTAGTPDGDDSFTYAISDGRGASASATVTINVMPLPNQPPIAVPDNDAINQTVIAVLANGSDPDGDPLTIIGLTQPITTAGGPAGTVTVTGSVLTCIR